MPFSVETYDSFDTPSGNSSLLKVGSFATAKEALACAKKVVDDQLRSYIKKGLKAEDAVRSFSAAGEIPMIFGKGNVKFQPFEYAKKRALEIELE